VDRPATEAPAVVDEVLAVATATKAQPREPPAPQGILRCWSYGQTMSRFALRERPSRPFDLGSEVIDVRVRESSRARTTRVIVGPRRPLEIIVPCGTPDTRIDSFLETKRRWISEKVATARAIAARPAQLGFEQPATAFLAGEALPIERLNGRRAVAGVAEGRVLLRGPNHSAPAALERWYRREARLRITAMVERESARLGVEFKAIGIRDPKSRWGSCSRRGNLSFSWRLILAPPEVLEYVVVHELLHLREPNHSRAFWRLVDGARPGWEGQARWLSEHGQELLDYRPTSWRSGDESHRRKGTAARLAAPSLSSSKASIGSPSVPWPRGPAVPEQEGWAKRPADKMSGCRDCRRR